MRSPLSRRAGTMAMLAIASVVATACGSSADEAEPRDGAGSTDGGTTTAANATAEPRGAGETGSRLAVSFTDGIAVLDGETLEVVEEFESEEFTRLNAMGDGRTVLVTMSDGFQVLDTAEPRLTDLVFEADTPGHVVRHHGKTVLYADGTSDTTIVDSDALEPGARELPETELVPGQEAHHGVSIVLADGTLLTTIGDSESRSGARAVDADGREIARSEECPGVHGEGTAAGERVVFGCEDGALLYADGEFTKLDARDPYGRMGNAYVSESSPLVVGDYKDDPDAEGYLLDQVALIDTEARTHEVAQLPEGVQYTWRGVVRGPGDMAYLLGTDGAIHVLDPATGEISRSFPVVDPWEGPAEWQDPHPAMIVDGDVAYVADPAARAVHALDLVSGEITATGTLDAEPNEMAVALG